MASKEDMAAVGIKSPDVIDAMSFAFLEDAVYIARDSCGASARRQEQINELDRLLAAADSRVPGEDGEMVEI